MSESLLERERDEYRRQNTILRKALETALIDLADAIYGDTNRKIGEIGDRIAAVLNQIGKP